MVGQLTKFTLIQRIRNQMDDKSWEEFTTIYSPYISTILFKAGVDANTLDDLKQQILLNIWKSIENFEYNPDKCRFRTWLGHVCRNAVYNHFRSRKQPEQLPENTITIAESSDIDTLIEQEWRLFLAEKALETVTADLGESTMKAYNLYYQGKVVKEIAKELNVAENTVYVYCKRVKEAMAREIVILKNDLG